MRGSGQGKGKGKGKAAAKAKKVGASTPAPVKPEHGEEEEEDIEEVEEAGSSDDDEEEEEVAEEEDDEDDEEEATQIFKKGGKKTAADQKAAKQKGKIQHLSSQDQEMAAFRRRLKIQATGSNVPNPMATFDEMKQYSGGQAGANVAQTLLRNIEKSAYKEPTAIQMQSLPAMMSGRDLLATAPTGSGKTASFVIPIIMRLKQRNKGGIRAIVLSPARELARQTFQYFERMALGTKLRVCLLSKATQSSIAGQESGKHAAHNMDVLVATPMRLLHLLQEEALQLHQVECVCLDEADKLLEAIGSSSFVEQVDEILAACTGANVQRAMFSATMLPAVQDLAASVLRDPVGVTIGTVNAGASTIKQKLLFVGREEGKLLAVRQIVQEGLKPPVLIFVQDKDRAKALYQELIYDGLNVDCIHSDRSQQQRDNAVKQFRTGETWILIATELLGRGMDFKGVNMVVNYDFPPSAVSYVHRIGRTGRAGRQGEAVTFFTERDLEELRSIANVMRLSGCEVPDWMLTIKKKCAKDRRDFELRPPRRARVSTVSGYDLKNSKRKQSMVQGSQTRQFAKKAKQLPSKKSGGAK